MGELKVECPAGKRRAEMILVEMLKDKRSWFDYMAIIQALSNLRLRSKQMESERNMLSESGNSRELLCGKGLPLPKKWRQTF